MKPDFILIGAMKCGTSTVSAYLEDHPDVFMLPGQEPNFFSHDEVYARGTGWYEALFEGEGAARLIGEGSNAYASGRLHPQAAARMAAYMDFPREHWAQIASTNPLERVNREIKRRADVIGIFPNDGAIIRLVGALMLETNDEWTVARRYMSLETLARVTDNPTVRLPAVAT